MYVIRDSAGVIYPADLCTWEQVDNGGQGGYDITNVNFYGTGAAVAKTGCELGYIHKTGRFVQITA